MYLCSLFTLVSAHWCLALTRIFPSSRVLSVWVCCCWRFVFSLSFCLHSHIDIHTYSLVLVFVFLGFYSLSRIWKVFVQSSFVLSHQCLGPHKYVWEGLKTKRQTNEKNQIKSKREKTTRTDDIQYLFLTAVYIVRVEYSGTKIGDEWNWITHTQNRWPQQRIVIVLYGTAFCATGQANIGRQIDIPLQYAFPTTTHTMEAIIASIGQKN